MQVGSEQTKNFVGLITARGGSKGIPKKNIAPVGGRPLIAWTLQAAVESCYIQRTILSTDCEEIAATCDGRLVEVPFIRPSALAQDDTPHSDVIKHAIQWLNTNSHQPPEYIVLLQPTSPLRTSADIDASIQLAIEKDADSVVSVCPAPVHPFWTRSIDDSGRLREFMPWPSKHLSLRRQTLPSAFALNGAVYVIRSAAFLAHGTYFGERTYAYVMPPSRSLDIGTPWDLHLADLILRAARVSGQAVS